MSLLTGTPRQAPPEPRYTVPVTEMADDPEAALAWLDERAAEAGRIYSASRWPGSGVTR